MSYIVNKKILCQILCASLMLVVAIGCASNKNVDRKVNSGVQDGIDYEALSTEKALQKKYNRMLPHTRNEAEKEILEVIYKGLLATHTRGKTPDVNMEDLMAHALQEAMILINRVANNEPFPENAEGKTLWDIRMIPGNDLLGNVSWSVWQTITANYLIYGRHFNNSLATYYDDFIVKYGIESGQGIPAEEATIEHINTATNLFKKELEAVEGTEKAQQMLNQLLADVGKVIRDKPVLHAQVIASLIQANYDWLGVRDPFAVRAYYWYQYQQNLNPEAWLSSVHTADIEKRGDYGKQVTLGNSYNDRGLLFWYTVTKDYEAIEQIKRKWNADDAAITQKDLRLLREKGYIHYPDSVYQELHALL